MYVKSLSKSSYENRLMSMWTTVDRFLITHFVYFNLMFSFFKTTSEKNWFNVSPVWKSEGKLMTGIYEWAVILLCLHGHIWFNTTIVNLAGKPSIEIKTIIPMAVGLRSVMRLFDAMFLTYSIPTKLPAERSVYRDCKHTSCEKKIVKVVFRIKSLWCCDVPLTIQTSIPVQSGKRRNISYQRCTTR